MKSRWYQVPVISKQSHFFPNQTKTRKPPRHRVMKSEKLKACEMKSVLLWAALNKKTFNKLTESGTSWDSQAINQREICLLNRWIRYAISHPGKQPALIQYFCLDWPSNPEAHKQIMREGRHWQEKKEAGMSLSIEFDYDRDTNARGSINNYRLSMFNPSCSRHQKQTNPLQINSLGTLYAVLEDASQYAWM